MITNSSVFLRPLVGGGSFREPYNYINDPLAACAGIVSEVYIPQVYSYYNSSSSLSSASVTTVVSRLEPPFAVQWLMEQEVRGVMASVPSWVSTECHWSLRKALCTSRLLRPELKIFRGVLVENGVDPAWVSATLQSALNVSASVTSRLLDYSFYAPSYPHRSVCAEYVSVCGAFADRLERTAGISTFHQDCNARVNQTSSSMGVGPSGGFSTGSSSCGQGEQSHHCAYAYPSQQRQTVEVFPLAVVSSENGSVLFNLSSNSSSSGSGVMMLNVTTSANYLDGVAQSSLSQQFSTQCPHGFVVPEDKSHPRNHWMVGTGCAEACRYGNEPLSSYGYGCAVALIF
jgi:hypothetical protein